MKEFWSDLVTRKSWEELIALSKEYKFILIGGWAAYLWTGMHKSKDIDLVIDYDTLNLLRGKFNLEKNERLRKYEIKMGEFDVDLYLPGYSKLAFPVEKLGECSTGVQGMRVPSPEALVILKQGAEIERRGSIKGRKDLIDIMAVLLNSGFSLDRYREIIAKYGLKGFEEALEREVMLFSTRDLEYLGINLNEFAKWRRKFLAELKKR